jgi:hypothetical protein
MFIINNSDLGCVYLDSNVVTALKLGTFLN